MRRVIIESPFSGGEYPSHVDYFTHEGIVEACITAGYLGYGKDGPEAQRSAMRSRNRAYLIACLRDSLSRGEAPFASHGLYTLPGLLDDDKQAERDLGIAAGFSWGDVADGVAVYTDMGVSDGMRAGIERALERGAVVEYRTLGGWAV